jgi:hypothetical protein
MPADDHSIPRTYVADFVVFGPRTRRATKKTYTHAYGAVRDPSAREWVWIDDIYIGFSKSRQHAEEQISKRRKPRKGQGWTGPFEIVETKECGE